MPLLRIEHYPGVKQVFIAGEGIADLATVELLPGERQVRMGATDNEHLAAGVARGTVVSGALVRVITQGIISGVKTALAVQAGDRLTIATSGRVVPFSTITPGGAISGYITGDISGYITGAVSGYVAGAVSGYITGNISGYIPAGATGLASGIQSASGIISGFITIVSPSIFSSGAILGAFSSGAWVGGFHSGAIAGVFSSGAIVGAFNSGAFVGTAFKTGRVLGRALTSGLSGLGIQVLVCLE